MTKWLASLDEELSEISLNLKLIYNLLERTYGRLILINWIINNHKVLD